MVIAALSRGVMPPGLRKQSASQWKGKTMQINLRALKTVALFVSNEETRYYLMGVNVEARNDGFVFTATNGHYLTMARHDYLDNETAPDWGTFIIPISLIDRVKLGRYSDIASIDLGADGLSISINYMGVTYTENRVEGSFPDARRVIPAKISGETAQFNPAYVALFGKAKALIAGKKSENMIVISHNGYEPALVDFVPEGADFQGFGVLMPYRAVKPMDKAPAWAHVIGSSVSEAA